MNMNVFLFIKNLFKSEKTEPISIPVSGFSPVVMLDYGTTNVSVNVRYTPTKSFSIDANKFCTEFREGRGYEFIDKNVNPIPLTMKERDVIINRLREWGHQHQNDA